MNKARKIIYWVATLWLSLGMLSTAAVQLFHIESGNDLTAGLGYPPYFYTLLAAWKMLGVIAILLPGTALLKEWAYAGFFFAMTGAAISHIAAGDGAGKIFPSLLLLALTILSWYLRPAGRKWIRQTIN